MEVILICNLYLIIIIGLAVSKVYDKCELARELIDLHDIPEEQVATWVCIAKHESNFDTSAVGHLNYDQSGDHGLFQISDKYWCSVHESGRACNALCSDFEDNNIEDDVECIKMIYEEHQRLSGNGFNAWAVYPHYCQGHSVNNYIDGCFEETNVIRKPKARVKNFKKPQTIKSISNIFLDGTITLTPLNQIPHDKSIKTKLYNDNFVVPKKFSNIFLDGLVVPPKSRTFSNTQTGDKTNYITNYKFSNIFLDGTIKLPSKKKDNGPFVTVKSQNNEIGTRRIFSNIYLDGTDTLNPPLKSYTLKTPETTTATTQLKIDNFELRKSQISEQFKNVYNYTIFERPKVFERPAQSYLTNDVTNSILSNERKSASVTNKLSDNALNFFKYSTVSFQNYKPTEKSVLLSSTPQTVNIKNVNFVKYKTTQVIPSTPRSTSFQQTTIATRTKNQFLKNISENPTITFTHKSSGKPVSTTPVSVYSTLPQRKAMPSRKITSQRTRTTKNSFYRTATVPSTTRRTTTVKSQVDRTTAFPPTTQRPRTTKSPFYRTVTLSSTIRRTITTKSPFYKVTTLPSTTLRSISTKNPFYKGTTLSSTISGTTTTKSPFYKFTTLSSTTQRSKTTKSPFYKVTTIPSATQRSITKKSSFYKVTTLPSKTTTKNSFFRTTTVPSTTKRYINSTTKTTKSPFYKMTTTTLRPTIQRIITKKSSVLDDQKRNKLSRNNSMIATTTNSRTKMKLGTNTQQSELQTITQRKQLRTSNTQQNNNYERKVLFQDDIFKFTFGFSKSHLPNNNTV